MGFSYRHHTKNTVRTTSTDTRAQHYVEIVSLSIRQWRSEGGGGGRGSLGTRPMGIGQLCHGSGPQTRQGGTYVPGRRGFRGAKIDNLHR